VGGAGLHPSAVGYTYGASLSTAITAGLDVDYGALLQAFIAKEKGALLAAALLRPDGLTVQTSRNVKGAGYSSSAYACRSEEARSTSPSSRGGGGGSGSGGSAAAAEPWPVLFSTSAMTSSLLTLRSLWPTIRSAIDERRAPLKLHGTSCIHGAVTLGPRVIAELAGAEHTLWLLPIDERVLVVLALSGRRGASDAAVTSVLDMLATGLNHDQLIAGSMRGYQGGVRGGRSSTGSWWDKLLYQLGLRKHETAGAAPASIPAPVSPVSTRVE